LYVGRISEMRLLEYLYGKGFGSKIVKLIRKLGDGKGPGKSRETGCGGQRHLSGGQGRHVRVTIALFEEGRGDMGW